MTDKRYELWTRLLLITAVGSSIGFAKAGEFSSWLGWLVGAIGIAAVVAGSVIYFRNSEQSDGESNNKRKPAPLLLGTGASPPEATLGTTHQLAFWQMQHLREIPEINLKGSMSLYVDNLAGADYFLSHAYWTLHRDMVHYNWVHAEAEKRLKERETETFVDAVVEIVQRLSPECEFELDLERRLTIRPRAQATTQAKVMPLVLGIHKERGSA